MTLRLDTYPEVQISAHMNPQSTSSATPTLCCLLHTGSLPTSHQIQVWVGGVQQVAEQEGGQQVFSWQCAEGIEMSIHLLHRGRLTKAWRGWWQGETTIAHTGTLAVQVYCAGVSQPAGLTPLPPTPVLSSVRPEALDQHNGVHPQDVPASLTWPALLGTSALPLPTTHAEPEDDLWSNPPLESHAQAAEINEEKVAEDETEQNLLEEGWEDAELEEEGREEENQENVGSEGTQDGPASVQDGQAGAGEPLETSDASGTALLQTSAPAGTIIATFPANTVWSQAAHQEALDRLATLLSAMPSNTILIDLRQHSPTSRARRAAAKSGSQKLGLSKELLRCLYGGRYWDRGSTIQTSRRLKSAHPMRWYRTVVNPDDRDGLGELTAALTQGFSLLVIDGDLPYAESARAAVLHELRQRVANVCEGSCS